MTTSERVKGVVKFFDDTKGFGFITPNGATKDIFVHRSDLVEGLRALVPDQKVSYVVAKSDRPRGDGTKATLVQVES
jgi:cold shock protein